MHVRVSLLAGHIAYAAASANVAVAGTGSGDKILLRAADVMKTPYSSLAPSSSLLFSDSSSPSNLSPRQQQPQHNTHLYAARAATASISSTATGNGTAVPFDFKAWETDTGAACLQALRQLMRASSPSGDSVCYNLLGLNPDSGTFESELRVYSVSPPQGPFAGVAPETIAVSVSYNGASVSPIEPAALQAALASGSGTTTAAADTTANATTTLIKARVASGSVFALSSTLVGSSMMMKRADDVFGMAKKDPELMKTYLLVGQIDKQRMTKQLSMSDIQSIVIPTVTLSAMSTNGSQTIKDVVNVNEAAFVNGVFSRERVMSDFAASQAAVLEAMEALRNGTAAFVLPGVQIMIFPIGFVITSAWLAIGLAAYGFGTIQRIQYASQYKQRRRAGTARGGGHPI